MQPSNNGLKHFGFFSPTIPLEVKMHKYRGSNPRAEHNKTLSYDKQAESINNKDDALRYIEREANYHIQLCKKLGYQISNNTEQWRLICEIQASLERIKDNSIIAQTQ